MPEKQNFEAQAERCLEQAIQTATGKGHFGACRTSTEMVNELKEKADIQANFTIYPLSEARNFHRKWRPLKLAEMLLFREFMCDARTNSLETQGWFRLAIWGWRRPQCSRSLAGCCLTLMTGDFLEGDAGFPMSERVTTSNWMTI